MNRNRILGIGALVLVVVLGIVAFLSVYVVDPTKYALVLRFGQPVAEALEPGLHFKVPLIDNVVYIEKRLIGFAPSAQQVADQDNEIVAGDQRRINVLAFGRYRVVDPLLFYQTVGTVETANSRLLAILDASVRSVLSTATFQQIVAEQRSLLMDLITSQVASQATTLGVEVQDVRIQRVDLPDVNTQAIYARMQTERQQEAAQIRAQGDEAARRIRALADRNVIVTRAIATQNGEIIRGQGDGEANRIFAEAFTQDPDFFAFYRSMQAYQEALLGDTTTMLLTPDSAFFRFFQQFGPLDGIAVNAGDLPPAIPLTDPNPILEPELLTPVDPLFLPDLPPLTPELTPTPEPTPAPVTPAPVEPAPATPAPQPAPAEPAPAAGAPANP